MIIIIWKYRKGENLEINGTDIILGKHRVGSVLWSKSRTKENSYSYFRAECYLPGIKKYIGTYGTEQEAKTALKRVVFYWIKQAGLLTI